MTGITGLDDRDLPLLFRAADSNSLKAQQAFVRATKSRLLALAVAAAAGAVVITNGTIDWPVW